MPRGNEKKEVRTKERAPGSPETVCVEPSRSPTERAAPAQHIGSHAHHRCAPRHPYHCDEPSRSPTEHAAPAQHIGSHAHPHAHPTPTSDAHPATRATAMSACAKSQKNARDPRAKRAPGPSASTPRVLAEGPVAQRGARLGLLPSGPDPVHASRSTPAPLRARQGGGAARRWLLQTVRLNHHDWRRGWDSNPRTRENLVNGFRNRRDRPLCHLSAVEMAGRRAGRRPKPRKIRIGGQRTQVRSRSRRPSRESSPHTLSVPIIPAPTMCGPRRGDRVADCACLESKCVRKSTEGSNPSLSAIVHQGHRSSGPSLVRAHRHRSPASRFGRRNGRCAGGTDDGLLLATRARRTSERAPRAAPPGG